MATLKRCDACHTIWDPDETQDQYSGYDRNLCSVSIEAPYDSSRTNRAEVRKRYETCQDCARAVVELLNTRSTQPS